MSGGSRTPTQGQARERQPSGSWNPSVDTYTSALRQALLTGTPDEPLVNPVERRLNALAAKRKSGSSATALISGVRLLEKLRIIQEVATEVHWMQARAIGKGRARRAEPKPVAT